MSTVSVLDLLVTDFLAMGNVSTDRLTSPRILAMLNLAYADIALETQAFRDTVEVTLSAEGVGAIPAGMASLISVRVGDREEPLSVTTEGTLDFREITWRDAGAGVPTDVYLVDHRTFQVNPPPIAAYQTAYVEAVFTPSSAAGAQVAALVEDTDEPQFLDIFHSVLAYAAVERLCAGLLRDDANAEARGAWAKEHRERMVAAMKEWRRTGVVLTP